MLGYILEKTDRKKCVAHYVQSLPADDQDYQFTLDVKQALDMSLTDWRKFAKFCAAINCTAQLKHT